MKLTHTVQVTNSLGLHIRPASLLAKLLQNYTSSVFISFNGQTVDARSVMSLLVLSIKQDSTIDLIIEGIDAEETLEVLKDAFENQFEETVSDEGQ